jgi:hypothetical protein
MRQPLARPDGDAFVGVDDETDCSGPNGTRRGHGYAHGEAS